MNTSALNSQFCRLVGISYPIVQAPMAGGPDSPELAAAVSNAGAFGSLGGAYLEPEELRAIIRKTKSLTQRPFSVNLFLPIPEPNVDAKHVEKAINAIKPFLDKLGLNPPKVRAPLKPDFWNQAQAVLEEVPRLMSFTFGIPDHAIIKDCKKRGILTMGTATSVEEGLALEAAHVDFICAQGIEAGGHRGTFSDTDADSLLGLFALVPLLVNTVRTPVIAAGGIMNGSGVVAALALGAQAVQLGTAFLTCKESGTSMPYRKALLKMERGKRTQFTRAFSGRTARGIANQFMREIDLKKTLYFHSLPKTQSPEICARRVLRQVSPTAYPFGQDKVLR